jgi:hypothetical protein
VVANRALIQDWNECRTTSSDRTSPQDDRNGRLIRHAILLLATAICTLADTMTETGLIGCLVTAICGSELLATRPLAARVATVALATVTRSTNRKDCATGAAVPWPQDDVIAGHTLTLTEMIDEDEWLPRRDEAKYFSRQVQKTTISDDR